MNGNSIFNTIRNRISDSMQSEIYNCAMYMSTLSHVNRGYNTDNIEQWKQVGYKGIVCGQSKCGSNANPTNEYCMKH